MTSMLIDPYRNRAEMVPLGMELSPLGILVPKRRRRRYDRPVGIDLFSGAGGFSCGFHQAGFHVAAACELDIAASCTYMVNLARPGVQIHADTEERMAKLAKYLDGRPHKVTESGLVLDNVAGSGWIRSQPADHPGCEHFYMYDVRNLTGEIILEHLDLDVGDVAVMFGGPPCQGFSQSGKQDVMDPRNSLVFEFARLVTEIQPKAFVIENVPPMLTMRTPEGPTVIDALCMNLTEGGYGEYDALRKAMVSAGETAGAATRGATSRAKKAPKKRVPESPDDAGQLDLFGGPT